MTNSNVRALKKEASKLTEFTNLIVSLHSCTIPLDVLYMCAKVQMANHSGEKSTRMNSNGFDTFDCILVRRVFYDIVPCHRRVDCSCYLYEFSAVCSTWNCPKSALVLIFTGRNWKWVTHSRWQFVWIDEYKSERLCILCLVFVSFASMLLLLKRHVLKPISATQLSKLVEVIDISIHWPGTVNVCSIPVCADLPIVFYFTWLLAEKEERKKKQTNK